MATKDQVFKPLSITETIVRYLINTASQELLLRRWRATVTNNGLEREKEHLTAENLKLSTGLTHMGQANDSRQRPPANINSSADIHPFATSMATPVESTDPAAVPKDAMPEILPVTTFAIE